MGGRFDRAASAGYCPYDRRRLSLISTSSGSGGGLVRNIARRGHGPPQGSTANAVGFEIEPDAVVRPAWPQRRPHDQRRSTASMIAGSISLSSRVSHGRAHGACGSVSECHTTCGGCRFGAPPRSDLDHGVDRRAGCDVAPPLVATAQNRRALRRTRMGCRCAVDCLWLLGRARSVARCPKRVRRRSSVVGKSAGELRDSLRGFGVVNRSPLAITCSTRGASGHRPASERSIENQEQDDGYPGRAHDVPRPLAERREQRGMRRHPGQVHIVATRQPVDDADERRVRRRDRDHSRHGSAPWLDPQAHDQVEGCDHDPEVAEDELEEVQMRKRDRQVGGHDGLQSARRPPEVGARRRSATAGASRRARRSRESRLTGPVAANSAQSNRPRARYVFRCTDTS
jgi:hypothetical protein